jgi:hypothetical protein
MRSTSLSLFALFLLAPALLPACADPEASLDSDAPEVEARVPGSPEPEPSPADTARPKHHPGDQDPGSYPAPHPSMPLIPRNGGAVLHDPSIVTVTFAGDAMEAKLQAFGDQVGGLKWWSTVHDGYGVGPATSAGHVTIPVAPPARMTDGDVQAWLAARVGDGTLPAPTDQSIYLLYYPQATTITFDDSSGSAASCQVFLGYHSTISVAAAGRTVPVAYAVINRCRGDLDEATSTASHELTEASTDPHPIDDSTAGYVTLKDNAWTGLGGENADMCAGVTGVTEAGWALTRVWNNVTAAAGDQPCVPVPDTGGVPYFNAGVVHERVTALPGTSVSTELDCYSFGPLTDPMTLSVGVPAGDPLKIYFDQKTCVNGDKVNMTLAVSASAQRGSDIHYTVFTTLPAGNAHLWRGMVHVR